MLEVGGEENKKSQMFKPKKKNQPKTKPETPIHSLEFEPIPSDIPIPYLGYLGILY